MLSAIVFGGGFLQHNANYVSEMSFCLCKMIWIAASYAAGMFRKGGRCVMPVLWISGWSARSEQTCRQKQKRAMKPTLRPHAKRNGFKEDEDG